MTMVNQAKGITACRSRLYLSKYLNYKSKSQFPPPNLRRAEKSRPWRRCRLSLVSCLKCTQSSYYCQTSVRSFRTTPCKCNTLRLRRVLRQASCANSYCSKFKKHSANAKTCARLTLSYRILSFTFSARTESAGTSKPDSGSATSFKSNTGALKKHLFLTNRMIRTGSKWTGSEMVSNNTIVVGNQSKILSIRARSISNLWLKTTVPVSWQS